MAFSDDGVEDVDPRRGEIGVVARDELYVLHREGVGQPRRHRGNRDQAGAHECDTGSGVGAKGLLHGISLIGFQCE